MAELTPKERLQPSLLDRLTDDHPEKQQESRDRRVLSPQKLRAVVLRDLAWLLNTGHLASIENLSEYPEVAKSVLNFGLPDLSGVCASSIDASEIERQVRQAIWDFEPRILRKTVRVSVTSAQDQMNKNALSFIIEGDLWAQPAPLRLLLKTEVDLETGNVTIAEGKE